MRSSSSDEASAVFEALCRVERSRGAGEHGPEAAIASLLRELTGSPGPERTRERQAARVPERPRECDSDGDRFPDFASEVAAETAADRAAAADDAHDHREHSAGRDAIIDGLLEILHSYRGLLDAYHRELDETVERRGRGEHDGDDVVLQRLRGIQTVLVKYPIAGRAAFGALVREGRRFAESDAGRDWMGRLARSPLLARARTLFEGLAAGIANDREGSLPSSYIDGLVGALDRDLERVLRDVADAEGDR